VILHTLATLDYKDKGHSTTCLDRDGEAVVQQPGVRKRWALTALPQYPLNMRLGGPGH
jgi:hypothetical protein